ncbi:hypothetical protein C8J56DRAFT_822572 [Mycena floridula]|nr:hypothetical protein C8J56DRAFT_822572 [Mycena floridula]
MVEPRSRPELSIASTNRNGSPIAGSEGMKDENHCLKTVPCQFEGLLLAFIQRLSHCDNELMARKTMTTLLDAASNFCDAYSRPSSSKHYAASEALRNHLHEYSTASSELKRRQPFAQALNTILGAFSDRKFDDLPDSSDLIFTVNVFGVLGRHQEGDSPLDSTPISESLNFWDIGFSRKLSKAAFPLALSLRRSSLDLEPSIPSATSRRSTSTSSSLCFSNDRLLENPTAFNLSKQSSQTCLRLSDPSLKYAEFRLQSAPLMEHAVGVVLLDEQLSVWWHDRESTIQSTAIDITTDLHYLVVLVILFQRFSDSDWGLSKVFSISQEGVGSITVNGRVFESTNRSVKPLKGSASSFGLAVSDPSNPEAKYFMKASFTETISVREADTIDKCHSLADGDTRILDHIPTVVASEDFELCSTSKIRALLGLPSPRSRILRILIFPLFAPITSLKGDVFWTAFWETVRCHFLLSRKGLQHGDISVNNLMYNPATQKAILNDYDHARFIPPGTTVVRRRKPTGTIPFMALGLLSPAGWAGDIIQAYRHDLESFAWVLLWICVCFRDGVEQRPKALDALSTNDHRACFLSKLGLGLRELESSPDYKTHFFAAALMIHEWRLKQYRRGAFAVGPQKSNDLSKHKSYLEEDVSQLTEMFDVVERNGKDVTLDLRSFFGPEVFLESNV